jgi:hypothetical protein
LPPRACVALINASRLLAVDPVRPWHDVEWAYGHSRHCDIVVFPDTGQQVPSGPAQSQWTTNFAQRWGEDAIN